MALVLQDRVRETSTTTGTGTITLGGAFVGYRTFSSCVPTGSIVYYCIQNTTAGYEGEWEVGYGTYTTSGNTLSRDTVYSSSAGGTTKVAFSSPAALSVFITQPAEQAVYQQTNGDLLLINGVIGVSEDGTTGTTLPNTSFQAFATGDYYMQANQQNLDSGSSASSDWVSTADNGSDTNNYIDMGMASSGYNYPEFSAQDPNSGYVISTGANLQLVAGKYGANVAGANASATDIVFVAGDLLKSGIRGFVKGSTGNWILGPDGTSDTGEKLQVTGTSKFTGNASFGSFVYSAANTAAGNSTTLATKAYVDTYASGINIHASCVYATTADLGSVTYNNGTDGVGATLTNAGTQAALQIDGHTFTGTDVSNAVRVLVKNESNAAYNGIYTVTNQGSGSTNWVLTRATDYDTGGTGEGAISVGDYTFITSGSTNAYTSWVQTTTGTVTVGTTNLVFAQFSQATQYTGTAPINVSGQTIALTGVVDVAHGGTNVASYTSGDLLYASGATTLSKRAIGSTGNVLIVSGGLPSWGTVDLSSSNAVTSTLTQDHGGTGFNTYTLGDLIYSNATNTLAKLPGQTTTSQKLLSQTGDGVNSAAPTWTNSLDGFTLANATVQNTSAVTLKDTSFTLQDDADPTKQAQFNLSGITTGVTRTLTLPNADTTLFGTVGGTITGATTFSSGLTASSTITLNGSVSSTTSIGTNAVAGTTTIGGASQTGTITVGQSTKAQTLNVGTGATETATTKTINIGTGGVSGSTTAINIGSANGTTITLTGTVSGTISNATYATTAGTATNIAGGAAGSIPYQSAANTTVLLASGSGVLVGGTTPAWSTAPTLTGTNFSGIPNSATTASSANGASTIVARDLTGNFTANGITATTFTGSGAALTNLNASNVASGTIPSAILGNSTVYIGTTATALNRSSANQALTGISSVTMPGSTSGTVQVIPAAVAGTGTVFTIPATTGTAVTTGDTGTVTNTMLAGSIANAKLANSSVTINGSAVSLGGSITVTSTATNALTIGTGLSGTSYNGSTAVTIANTGVLSVSGGTTGLTPATATTGAVTLGGTLVVGNGGTGVATLSGLAYGNGTSAFSAATAAQVVAVIGSTAVANATYATSAGSATSATSATNATNATNVAVTDDVATATSVYPAWVGATSGNTGVKISSTKLTMVPSTGTVTSAGNFVANSDEKLKANWRPVQDDFVTKLADVKSGIYDRVDIDLTQAGVSAQSWQKLLPETVQKGDDGTLSVAYGNAALVAAVELAKEVVKLREELQALKAKTGA